MCIQPERKHLRVEKYQCLQPPPICQPVLECMFECVRTGGEVHARERAQDRCYDIRMFCVLYIFQKNLEQRIVEYIHKCIRRTWNVEYRNTDTSRIFVHRLDGD